MVLASCWTQAGLNYSIVACTSFCLKPFMAAVNTNYGNAAGTTSASNSRYQYEYSSKKNNTDGVLDTISGSRIRSQFKRLRNSRSEDHLDTFALTTIGGKGESDEKCADNPNPAIFRGQNPGSSETTCFE